MVTEVELGEFLRSRRGRLTPRSAGIEPHGSTRRVAGLKREEVARLAGVSVDYYARLEQGRPVRFSKSVLEAVGRALQLGPVDQAHLNDLVNLPNLRGLREKTGRPQVLPAYERIVRCITHQPAFVTDWRLDLLVANPLALALYLQLGTEDPAERNFARFVFDDPAARNLFMDWRSRAELTVAAMRRSLARHPEDPELLGLVSELRERPEFNQLWEDYALVELTRSCRPYNHPLVGEIWMECDNVRVVGGADQLLTIGSAEVGSRSEAALSRLAALASRADVEPVATTAGP